MENFSDVSDDDSFYDVVTEADDENLVVRGTAEVDSLHVSDDDAFSDGGDDESEPELADARSIGGNEEGNLRLLQELRSLPVNKLKGRLNELCSDYPLDLDEKDELQFLVENSTNKKTRDKLFKQLFEFISVHAASLMPSLSMQKSEQKKLFTTYAGQVAENMINQEEHKLNIMKNFISNDSNGNAIVSFPLGFADYLLGKKESTEAVYMTTRAAVRNTILPLFYSNGNDGKDLPSGCSLGIWHFFMRKCIFYRLEAPKLAKNCIMKRWKRVHGKAPFRQELHQDTIATQIFKYKFDKAYLPEGWLTFLFAAHPKLLNADGRQMPKCFREADTSFSHGSIDAIGGTNSAFSSASKRALQQALALNNSSSISPLSFEGYKSTAALSKKVEVIHVKPKPTQEELAKTIDHWCDTLYRFCDDLEKEDNETKKNII